MKDQKQNECCQKCFREGEVVITCGCECHKQSETLKPEDLSMEERVIEEYRNNFSFLQEIEYIRGGNAYEKARDFILKSLQQAKQEYKEELLKKIDTFGIINFWWTDGSKSPQLISKQDLIKIIQND